MNRYVIAALTFISLAGTANAEPAEALPPGSKITKLEANPPRLELKTPFDYSQLVITGHLAGGGQIDVTRMVQIEAPAELVRVNAARVVRPVADGNGVLTI